MKPTVIIFAKQPRLGRVKSRLARDIGAMSALNFYRRNLVRLHRRLAASTNWRLVWYVSPDAAASARHDWPKGVTLRPQGRGDLGQRMSRALASCPPGPAILIGSDIPGIDVAVLEQTVTLLGAKDAVFGPAEDGGFWLVGFKRVRALPYGLFRHVRWSGPKALEDSIATLPVGTRIGFAPRLADVDDGASYANWKEGELEPY